MWQRISVACVLAFVAWVAVGCSQSSTQSDAASRETATSTRIATYFLSPGLAPRDPVVKVASTAGELAVAWREWGLRRATRHNAPVFPHGRRVVLLVWSGTRRGGFEIGRIAWKRTTATIDASTLPEGKCNEVAVVGGSLTVLAVSSPSSAGGNTSARRLRGVVSLRERTDCVT